MAEAPPPIPLKPAGFGWRSLAFIADCLPLSFVAQYLADRTAGTEALAGRAALEAWVTKAWEAYLKVAQTGNADPFMKVLEVPPEAVGDWFVHAGIVSMLTFTLGLGLQEIFFEGRTLGKAIVNLRVIDVRTGEPPTFAGCILRSAWKAMFLWFPSPIIGILSLVNFHLPLFRRDNRAIHDLTTFTQVVDGRTSR